MSKKLLTYSANKKKEQICQTRNTDETDEINVPFLIEFVFYGNLFMKKNQKNEENLLKEFYLT